MLRPGGRRHWFIRIAAAGALALAASSATAQTPRVYVRRAAPGELGVLMNDVLSRPYVVRHEDWNTRLFRDSVFATSVVVVGSDATVASTVHGDVLVVNGNLFLRPGAHIDGRAIAVGGGVYDSPTAAVAGRRVAFRQVRFDVDTTAEGLALDYRPPPTPEAARVLRLPAPYGFGVPTYTRVDGAGLSWGPRVVFADERIAVAPSVTYRSDLGEFDPALSLDVRFGRGWRLSASGERGTFSNDAWILPDPQNSITVLVAGRDYRNYWRADRVDGRIAHEWGAEPDQVVLWAGARTERDWSVSAGGPWSITGQGARDGIIRPNPAIEHGRLSSALAGVSVAHTFGDVRLFGVVTAEQVVDAPRDERFTQGTIDAAVGFPTFGAQRFSLRAHAVVTGGDTAAPQRFSYLGGAGTLATRRVLEMGGDRLLFIESMYSIPITPLRVPLLGPPVVSLRHAIGAAGVGTLPGLVQNIGVRLSLGPLWTGYDVDPATRDDAFSVGLSARAFR